MQILVEIAELVALNYIHFIQIEMEKRILNGVPFKC